MRANREAGCGLRTSTGVEWEGGCLTLPPLAVCATSGVIICLLARSGKGQEGKPDAGDSDREVGLEHLRR